MRHITLTTLLLLILTIAACATPVTPTGQAPTATTSAPDVPASTPLPVVTPPAGDLTIMFNRSGGIAGVQEAYTLKPDGSLDTSKGPKQADGGATAAAKLASQIAATGIYAVAPGKYLPASPCCDRFTYDLSLTAGGKTFTYTTMERSETAPAALNQTIGLIAQYIAAAR
jgi:hypothetical protein